MNTDLFFFSCHYCRLLLNNKHVSLEYSSVFGMMIPLKVVFCCVLQTIGLPNE